MHKQNRSDREIGLENIMESMYSEKTATCSKCQGKGCKHCDGTGKHTVNEAPLAHDISRNVGMEPALQDANPYIGMVLKKIFDEFNALQGQDLPPAGPGSKSSEMFKILYKWMDEPAARLAGTKESTEGEVCPKCGKVHTINAGCSKVHEAGASDHVPPHDADKLQRAKERGYDEPSDVDHHNQYMMDQDLLQPLHAAAIEAGAKDINDWMIQQIKAQGENWTSWFIDTVIRGE